MNIKTHWEDVYASKDATEVSWYQPHAATSLQLILSSASQGAAVIDVGGGASTLVDALLDKEFENITVLDVSAAALSAAQARLGARAASVTWLEADITRAALPPNSYEVWHDRAVFHFLTRAADRRAYVQAATDSLKAGGHLVVATFAPDGPTRCSGLDVMRYDAAGLAREFGATFELVESRAEHHQTPLGDEQKFTYCHLRKR